MYIGAITPWNLTCIGPMRQFDLSEPYIIMTSHEEGQINSKGTMYLHI